MKINTRSNTYGHTSLMNDNIFSIVSFYYV